MKIIEFKNLLSAVDTVNFKHQNETKVPDHFHITEVGVITKDFIDCGGTLRKVKSANFQLWSSNDYDHRLKPEKLLNIIALSEKFFEMEDLDIEIEFQTETIGKYDLSYDQKTFILIPKQTDCLAPEKCEVPQEKIKVSLNGSVIQESCCSPEGGCC
jgi:hypothetical protein